MVKDILSRCHMSYIPQLIRDIVAIRPGTVRIRDNQVIATDIADHALFLLQLHYHFLAMENELYQSSVFLDSAAQPLHIVMVDLDVAIKGLHLLCPIEQIVGVTDGTSELPLFRAVAIVIVAITIVRQYFLTQYGL